MKKKTLTFQKLAVWAGMLGPALFVIVFTLEGALRPGYNALSTYVSALSLGPRGWVQITNFIVIGVLLLAFTRAVSAEFRNGKTWRGGVILLTIIGFCYLLSGPFVMDPTGTPLNQTTLHGNLHGIFGAIVFLLMPISCFVYLRRFRVDPKWHSLRGWTIILGTISAIGTLLLTLTTKSPGLQASFSGWDGLIQRTAIVPFMIWVFVFALYLLKQGNRIENHVP